MLFTYLTTPMVKWLSCLPSKQAARVRFPFGVFPFCVTPFVCGRGRRSFVHFLSSPFHVYKPTTFEAPQGFVKFYLSGVTAGRLIRFPQAFDMHFVPPNYRPQV
jgi:hypothetical protein